MAIACGVNVIIPNKKAAGEIYSLAVCAAAANQLRISTCCSAVGGRPNLLLNFANLPWNVQLTDSAKSPAPKR